MSRRRAAIYDAEITTQSLAEFLVFAVRHRGPCSKSSKFTISDVHLSKRIKNTRDI